MRVCIERIHYSDKQTTGRLFVYEDDGTLVYHCFTLELPWKNNERRVSCIPKGVYRVIKHQSPKFKQSFWIQDVPNRSEILIHCGNFHYSILGCVLTGSGLKDINGDGLPDVTSSKHSIRKLYSILPDEFTLTIE